MDPLIRDPLCSSLLSIIKAILSLIDSYICLSSLIKAIFERVSKWGSLPSPMKFVLWVITWMLSFAFDGMALPAAHMEFK